MTSFGFGEIGLVLVLILMAFDAKQIGKALKWFGSLRSKFYRMQRDFKYQFDNLMAEEEEKDNLEKIKSSSDEMRKWGKEKIRGLSHIEKNDASQAVVKTLENFEPYQNAKIVAAYSSLHDELDTLPLINKILSDGKTLILPYLQEKRMYMAPISDFHKDTQHGPYGILEPVEKYRNETQLSPDIIIIPGRCFDEQGGRIGRGKGYYDKYLAKEKGCRVGLCYDAQISRKKLSLKTHDKRMDYIISEKRLIDLKERMQ
jgi:5-formyltetrahydrofolate cyclo-ligase